MEPRQTQSHSLADWKRSSQQKKNPRLEICSEVEQRYGSLQLVASLEVKKSRPKQQSRRNCFSLSNPQRQINNFNRHLVVNSEASQLAKISLSLKSLNQRFLAAPSQLVHFLEALIALKRRFSEILMQSQLHRFSVGPQKTNLQHQSSEHRNLLAHCLVQLQLPDPCSVQPLLQASSRHQLFLAVRRKLKTKKNQEMMRKSRVKRAHRPMLILIKSSSSRLSARLFRRTPTRRLSTRK